MLIDFEAPISMSLGFEIIVEKFRL